MKNTHALDFSKSTVNSVDYLQNSYLSLHNQEQRVTTSLNISHKLKIIKS